MPVITPALTDHLQWHCFTPEKSKFLAAKISQKLAGGV
ncbi:hypothetical protein A464_669 [Salmonella bongori N268-08]|uniref:Uncharacterized protein n=1 Tax=Salmonella bongori N268-08 TaxID=1197719 RepID=S5N5U3_SALBN|nr:hypothetical protein A464_669 [Salmonella bongori N268-08]